MPISPPDNLIALEKLRQAVTIGIEDWMNGRIDDRPIDEILDEIDREEIANP